jgi:hypothetical protein
LLRATNLFSEAAHVLCSRFGISHRQAYRYIKIAQSQSKRIVIPEPKKVFTIKLPLGIIERIRQNARQSGRSISDIVAEALRLFLSKR